jgi:hypothetical protein
MTDNTIPTEPAKNHISAVREMLLATMADLRNPTHPMDIQRALAVSSVAQTVINSAKVEVDYLQKTGQTSTPFLEVPPVAIGNARLQSGAVVQSLTHRLQG